MFELLISITTAAFVFAVDILWLRVLVLIVWGLVVSSGLYSMLYGAPYVAMSDKRIKAVLELSNFSVGDRVADLGAGDGRVVRAVAKEGVLDVVGYEFSLPTFVFAKIVHFFKAGGGVLKFRNFWRNDFSNKDVLICFLLEKSMQDFEKRIWPTLSKGTRVVSNEFKMRGVKPVKSMNRVVLYIKK